LLRSLLVPAVGAALSAVGALISDLSTDRARVLFMRSDTADVAAINAVLGELAASAGGFRARAGGAAVEYRTEFVVEARYPQADLGDRGAFCAGRASTNARQVQQLVEDFPRPPRELYAVDDPTSTSSWSYLACACHCRLQMRRPECSPAHVRETGADPATIYLRAWAACPPSCVVSAICRQADDRRSGDRRIRLSRPSSSTPALPPAASSPAAC
jgi:N-methylhydantoinase A